MLQKPGGIAIETAPAPDPPGVNAEWNLSEPEAGDPGACDTQQLRSW